MLGTGAVNDSEVSSEGAATVTEQNWTNIGGAVAFQLIDRHSEDWEEIGRKMEAWRDATTADLRKSRDEALLDAEKAREERNSVGVEIRYDRYRTLAELVRGARLIEEMTLVDLAEAAGTSKSYLSEIENGVSWRVSVQLADRLANALSISLGRIVSAAHESDRAAAMAKKEGA